MMQPFIKYFYSYCSRFPSSSPNYFYTFKPEKTILIYKKNMKFSRGDECDGEMMITPCDTC